MDLQPDTELPIEVLWSLYICISQTEDVAKQHFQNKTKGALQ